jgi:ABC-2 type transport system permease protein
MIKSAFFDTPLVRNSPFLRSFLTASWLGWQIESNWADPILFSIYSIARPIASILILVVMYSVVTDAPTSDPLFAYIYLGNAFYILVGQTLTGVSWAVISDREHYRMMKQIHTAPISTFAYMMGRGVARLIIGSISVIIVVGFGLVVFRLPVTFATIDWPLFVASMALGVLSVAAMGVVLGGSTLMMARHGWFLGDAVAGGLYLFTGAIFPLDLLPTWIRPLGFAFPVTYWLELARRALLPERAPTFTTFATYSDMQLLGVLTVFALALTAASLLFFRWAVHTAKERGMIDMETNY